MAAAHVQEYHIARIDQVRVLDLRPVQLPDLRPEPGVLEEFSGDIPQSIAFNHDMTIRVPFFELDFVGYRMCREATNEQQRYNVSKHILTPVVLARF